MKTCCFQASSRHATVRPKGPLCGLLKVTPSALSRSLPAPNVVMIDVEGYEYAAMQGLSRTLSDPTCRAVVCEVHPTLLPAGVNFEQLLDLLKSYGFGAIELRRTPGIQEFYAFASKS